MLDSAGVTRPDVLKRLISQALSASHNPKQRTILAATMDANFDFDHLARDLSAEARGLTRMFFTQIQTEQEPLGAAADRMRSNKGGVGKVAVARRMKRFRAAVINSPALLADETWGADGGRFVLATLGRMDRTMADDTRNFVEPTVVLLEYLFRVGDPPPCKVSLACTFPGHSIARWFERAAPHGVRNTEGLIQEMRQLVQDDGFLFRWQCSRVAAEVGAANLGNRLAMLSPTTGGAWITSVVRLETPAHREGWTDELEPEPELFVHSYFGGPEMTTAQADNVEELRRFRDDNLSLIDMPADRWPKSKLDRMVELTSPAIWEPKAAALP